MTLDDLLTSTATTPDPDSRALVAARARLDDRVAAAGTVVLAHRRRAVRRRRLALTLAGAAAAATLAVLPLTSLGGGEPAPAEAAEVLVVASEAAAAQPDDATGAPYWHTVSEHSSTGTADGAVFRRETWLSRSGPGLLLDGGVDGSDPIGLPPATFVVGGQSLDWDQLAALPTDPVALRSLLASGLPDNSRSREDELFGAVGDLLRENPVPPAVRAALWRIASQIPGVVLVGDVTDQAGRRGTAVEMTVDDGGGAQEVRRLVVDTTTGDLLEETDGSTDRDGRTMTTRYTYLEQGPADALPVQPQLPEGCASFDRC